MMALLGKLFGDRGSKSRSHVVGGVSLIILPETVTCNRCGKRGCAVLVTRSGYVGLSLNSKCFQCGKYRVLLPTEYGELYASAIAKYADGPLPDDKLVTEYVFSVNSL
jgi:hypothetical protein